MDITCDYVVEFNHHKHNPELITETIYQGMKEWDEILSSIVLKLFDLFFEKEFDYDISKILILDYFEDYKFNE